MDFERDKIALYTGDSDACKAVFEQLKESGDSIFKTTKRWLKSGKTRYRYVVFDDDQWTGSDLSELINENGIIKNLEIVKL
jgi:hypothetical protein